MMLKGSANYIATGEVIGFDGLKGPEVLATDAVLAWKTAIWLFMSGSSPAPSCHDIMTRMYRPSASDKAAGWVMGFGMTTNILAGAEECGRGTSTPQESDRLEFYQRFCYVLNTNPGPNLDCANQRPYQ